MAIVRNILTLLGTALLLTACTQAGEEETMTKPRTISLKATAHPMTDADAHTTRAALANTETLSSKYVRAWGYYQDSGNLLKSSSSVQESIQLEVNASGLGDTHVDWPEGSEGAKAMRFYVAYPDALDNVVTSNEGTDGSKWSTQPKISYKYSRDRDKDLMYGTSFDQYYDDVLEPSIPIQMQHITTALRFRKSSNIEGEIQSVKIDGIKTEGYYQETYNEETKQSTGTWTPQGDNGSITIENSNEETYITNSGDYGTSVVYVMPQTIAANTKITVNFTGGRILEGVLPATKWKAGYIVSYELGKSGGNNSVYKDIKHGLLYQWTGSQNITWNEDTRLYIALSDRIEKFLYLHMNENSYIEIEYSPTNKSNEIRASVMIWNDAGGNYKAYTSRSIGANGAKEDSYIDKIMLNSTQLSTPSPATLIRQNYELGNYLDYPIKIGSTNITLKRVCIYLDDLPNE